MAVTGPPRERCRCGADGALVEVTVNDGDEVVGEMCRPCLDRALGKAAELGAQFQALLAEGIDRRMANRIMTVRVDRYFAERRAS